MVLFGEDKLDFTGALSEAANKRAGLFSEL